MSNVIELSSDEELDQPRSKKIKIGPSKDDGIIVIDEDQTDLKDKNCDPLLIDSETSEKKNGEKGSQKDNIVHINDENDVEYNLPEIDKENSATINQISNEVRKQNGNIFNNEEVKNDNDNLAESEDLLLQIDHKEDVTSDVIDRFLELCRSSIHTDLTKEKFEEKVPVFKKVCLKANEYACSKMFKEKIEKLSEELCHNPELAIKHFHTAYSTLLENSNESHNTKRIEKLTRLYNKIQKEIERLETMEIDFDEEENSCFMKMNRYSERAVAIHKKIKQLERADPNYGRPYYSKINVTSSTFPEINRFLSIKYSDREKYPFPSYDGVDACIKKCIQKYDLQLNEAQRKVEVRTCFEQLGNLIQKRRKAELASVHMDYIKTIPEDPAKNDDLLNDKLKESKQKFNKEMKTVLDKFELRQESGAPAAQSNSSESEKSEDSD